MTVKFAVPNTAGAVTVPEPSTIRLITRLFKALSPLAVPDKSSSKITVTVAPVTWMTPA